MHKQITKEEAVGKTVKGFVASTKTAQMAVIFTDETFIGLGINRGFQAGPETVVVSEIQPKEFGLDLLTHVGVIDQSEMGKLMVEQIMEPVKHIVAIEEGKASAESEAKAKE